MLRYSKEEKHRTTFGSHHSSAKWRITTCVDINTQSAFSLIQTLLSCVKTIASSCKMSQKYTQQPNSRLSNLTESHYYISGPFVGLFYLIQLQILPVVAKPTNGRRGSGYIYIYIYINILYYTCTCSIVHYRYFATILCHISPMNHKIPIAPPWGHDTGIVCQLRIEPTIHFFYQFHAVWTSYFLTQPIVNITVNKIDIEQVKYHFSRACTTSVMRCVIDLTSSAERKRIKWDTESMHENHLCYHHWHYIE